MQLCMDWEPGGGPGVELNLKTPTTLGTRKEAPMKGPHPSSHLFD